jgi:hypothetical protein
VPGLSQEGPIVVVSADCKGVPLNAETSQYQLVGR